MTDTKINFVNAGLIAEERGISISSTLNSENISYSNLIKVYITFEDGSIEIAGSAFSLNHFRIVNIFGYELDFNPKGEASFDPITATIPHI